LLSGLERVHFGPSGALRIHGKPHRPDHDTDDASGNVLRDLGSVFLRELFSLNVVRLDLRADHGAVALRVLRLNDRYRMKITAGARGQSNTNGTRRKDSMTIGPVLPQSNHPTTIARGIKRPK
jgi:hypothetical protein